MASFFHQIHMMALVLGLVTVFLLPVSTVGKQQQQAEEQMQSPEEAELLPEDGAEGFESELSLFQKVTVLGRLPGFDGMEKKEQQRPWASWRPWLDLSTAVDILFGMVFCALMLHMSRRHVASQQSKKEAQDTKAAAEKCTVFKKSVGLTETRCRLGPAAGARPLKEEQKATSKKTSQLHVAVVSEDLEQCVALLREGADVNQPDNWLCSPLHLAAHRGSTQVVNFLLQHKAKVNATEAWDQTPLHLAAAAGHQAVCALLLRKGADKDALDAQDRTPLFLAGQNKHALLASFLLREGAGLGRGLAEERVPALLNNLILQHMLEKSCSDAAGRAERQQQEAGTHGGLGLEQA